MITEKQVERVVRYCIENKNDSHVLYQPKGFFSSFPGLSHNEVFEIWNTMESRGLTQTTKADLPESDNIHILTPLPAAYDYLVERNEVRKNYWKNWRWNICAAAITAAISVLLGLIASRWAERHWPVNPPKETLQEEVQQ